MTGARGSLCCDVDVLTRSKAESWLHCSQKLNYLSLLSQCPRGGAKAGERKFSFIIAHAYACINHLCAPSLTRVGEVSTRGGKFNPDTYSAKINFIGNVEAKYR